MEKQRKRMNIRDFVYKDGYFVYEEGNERYDIKIEENYFGFNLHITSNQKGIKAQRRGKDLAAFLSKHFCQHPTFRLENLFKEKTEVYIDTYIKKSEIQYYYVEMVQILFTFCVLIISICFDKSLTFPIYMLVQFSLSLYSIKYKMNMEFDGFLEENTILKWEFENQEKRKRNKKLIFVTLLLLYMFV